MYKISKFTMKNAWLDPIFREKFDQAMNLRNAGNFSEALESFKLLAKESPKFNGTFMMMGHICWKLNQNNEAAEYFGKAVEMSPKLEIASLGLFHSLWNQGKTDEALLEMRRFLTIASSDEYTEILEAILRETED
jgi:predicted Zn-dependent protease